MYLRIYLTSCLPHQAKLRAESKPISQDWSANTHTVMNLHTTLPTSTMLPTTRVKRAIGSMKFWTHNIKMPQTDWVAMKIVGRWVPGTWWPLWVSIHWYPVSHITSWVHPNGMPFTLNWPVENHWISQLKERGLTYPITIWVKKFCPTNRSATSLIKSYLKEVLGMWNVAQTKDTGRLGNGTLQV